MNPTITARRRTYGKYGHYWSARAENRMFCLYRCEHCGKIVLTPAVVEAAVDNTDHKTREEAEQAAAARIRWVLSQLKNPEDRDIPGFENVRFSFPQKCMYCEENPVWVLQREKAAKGTTVSLALFAVFFSALYFLLFFAVCTIVGNSSKSAAALLTLLSAVFCIAGMVLGPLLVRRRLTRKTAPLIEASLETTLPLFFDTREELEAQAQTIRLYRDLPPDSISARAEKEPDGFIVR